MWLVFGNSENLELNLGTDVCIALLNLVELIAEISNFLGYNKRRNEKWAFCDTSVCNTDWIKNISNETLTLNIKIHNISDLGSESYYTFPYYWLHIFLFCLIQ